MWQINSKLQPCIRSRRYVLYVVQLECGRGGQELRAGERATTVQCSIYRAHIGKGIHILLIKILLAHIPVVLRDHARIPPLQHCLTVHKHIHPILHTATTSKRRSQAMFILARGCISHSSPYKNTC
jgi:hypothetical protein